MTYADSKPIDWNRGPQRVSGHVTVKISEKGERINERHHKIIALKTNIEKTFLDLGKELHELVEGREYIDMGYASFEQYVSDPDINISVRKAHQCKAVYRKYVLELGVQPDALLAAGVTKLELVARLVAEDNKWEWIANAAALSKKDLEGRLKDMESNPHEMIRVYAKQMNVKDLITLLKELLNEYMD